MSAAPKATVDPLQMAAGATRNRVCCLGRVCIPPLFKGAPHCSTLSVCGHLARVLTCCFYAAGSRSQQLCVKLEPRGLLYVKLSLQERWDTQVRETKLKKLSFLLTTLKNTAGELSVWSFYVLPAAAAWVFCKISSVQRHALSSTCPVCFSAFDF